MNFWQRLGTIIDAILLTDALLGKEVITSDGTNLGTAADIKLDLVCGRIWLLVEHLGQWNMIPDEQLIGLAYQSVLIDNQLLN